MLSVFSLYIYWLEILPTQEARAAAYTALITGNLALAFSDSVESNASLFDLRRYGYWLIALLGAIITIAILYIPFLSHIFGFSTPSTQVLTISIAIGIAAGGWFALAKRLRKP